MFDAFILSVGIALLLLGGHWLVLGSVTIARRLGVSTLVIGLTIVAMGTSAPELAFNVIAASAGHTDLSFGNIIGSNIANIGLILAITAMVCPLAVHGRVVTQELPWLVVVSVVALLIAALPAALVGLSPQLPAWLGKLIDVGPAGFGRFGAWLLLLLFGLFLAIWYRMGRRDAADPLVRGLGEEAEAETLGSMGGAIALLLIGLASLAGGGQLAKVGAVDIARALGLGEAVIGLTIVAIATSLPELATALMAVRKGHHDLAIGNVVGSNLFNLLLVLGATAMIAPVRLPAHGVLDLGAMIALTGVLWLMAYSHEYKITRGEGAFLLMCYIGYLAWSVVRETWR